MNCKKHVSELRRFFICLNISTVLISLGFLASLQPTFYPTEAESRGAKPFEYGLVFGIVNFAACIINPFSGSFSVKIGIRKTLCIGALVEGFCGFLFAFLCYIQDVSYFIALSCILRFLEGVGGSFRSCSAIGIVMAVYPEKSQSMRAMLMCCHIFGYAVGPAIGAWFYSIGGFFLPFIIVGLISSILSALLIVTIPLHLLQNKTNETEINPLMAQSPKDMISSSFSTLDPRKIKLWKITTSKNIMVPLVNQFIILFGFGTVEAMIGPHLKKNGATDFDVALLFLEVGTTSILGSIFFAQLVDRCESKKSLNEKQNSAFKYALIGNIFWAIAMLFVGPVPFVKLVPNVGMIQGFFALGGFFYAFPCCLRRVQLGFVEIGYPDETSTYTIASGYWLCTYNMGMFLGPIVSGIVTTYWSFRVATAVAFGLTCFMILLNFSTASTRQRYEDNTDSKMDTSEDSGIE